jgi:hypothetical protein
MPLNSSVQAYHIVMHPDYAANWQLRLQVQLMFPK